jgi:hypothetical protein
MRRRGAGRYIILLRALKESTNRSGVAQGLAAVMHRAASAAKQIQTDKHTYAHEIAGKS